MRWKVGDFGWKGQRFDFFKKINVVAHSQDTRGLFHALVLDWGHVAKGGGSKIKVDVLICKVLGGGGLISNLLWLYLVQKSYDFF